MRFITSLIAAAFALWGATAAVAQPYPSRPIKIIVAYAAGQGTDIATRYLAEQISRDIGQPIVIENRAGAGGSLGTVATANARADGYTLTMGTNATHVLNQYLYARLPYNAEKDFEPVVLVGTFPMVMAVNTAAPINSVADLAMAIRRKTGAFDIAMPSTSARLVVELLKERSAAPLVGIPYKGSGTAVTDVLGGQLQVIVDTPTALRTYINAGKLRAIGVTSVGSSNLVPGVRPIAEQGFGGFEVIAWNALFAPKGTPPAVITFLNAAMNKVLVRPEVRHRLLELGFEPAGGTPVQLSAFAWAERNKWAPLIKAAGISAD